MYKLMRHFYFSSTLTRVKKAFLLTLHLNSFFKKRVLNCRVFIMMDVAASWTDSSSILLACDSIFVNFSFNPLQRGHSLKYLKYKRGPLQCRRIKKDIWVYSYWFGVFWTGSDHRRGLGLVFVFILRYGCYGGRLRHSLGALHDVTGGERAEPQWHYRYMSYHRYQTHHCFLPYCCFLYCFIISSRRLSPARL